MKIIVFHPFHPFSLNYLARTLPEHEIYHIGSSIYQGIFLPPQPNNLHFIEWKDLETIKPDLKILVSVASKNEKWIGGYDTVIQDPRQKALDIPIIWRDYWLSFQDCGNYPVISALWPEVVIQNIPEFLKSKNIRWFRSQMDFRDPAILNGWKGDLESAIVCNTAWLDKIPINQRLKKETRTEFVPRMELGNPIPFSEWLEKMRHARVYVETNPSGSKPLSAVLVEAMIMGMPVVVWRESYNQFDKIIRNDLDGFISSDEDYIINKVNDLCNNQDLAIEWGLKAKNRIAEFETYANIHKIWIDAIEEAFRRFEEKSFKIRTLGHNDLDLLTTFLTWLTPEAYKKWHHYGTSFKKEDVQKILVNDELKLIGIKEERIIVLGHLYSLEKKSCRLGLVSGIEKQGYGTRMMIALLREIFKRGIKTVRLSANEDNSRAIKLYKNFGFKVINEFNDRASKILEMELTIE